MGCGAQRGATGSYRGVKLHMTLLPKIRVDVVVAKIPAQVVIDAAKQALYTGHVGDGKIFVYDVRTPSRCAPALPATTHSRTSPT